MAIVYDLEMATPSSAAQVADQLNDIARATGIFDAPVTAEEILNDGVRTVLGTWVQVFEERPRPWDPVVTDPRITATVSVMFRMNKMAEISDQQDHMIRLVSGLLDSVSGEAVLDFQSEEIWLLRRDGDVFLHEGDDLWPSQRLALLAQPYRRATHTFSQS